VLVGSQCLGMSELGADSTQRVVQHTILRRSQSTRTAPLDSRPSRDGDACKSPSSTRPERNQPHRAPRGMGAQLEPTVQDPQVKKQPWIQHPRGMLRTQRERGSGRKASTRRVNLLGPKKVTDSAERGICGEKLTM
jgi:hypothetical protein